MAFLANGTQWFSRPFSWSQYSAPLTFLAWVNLPASPGSSTVFGIGNSTNSAHTVLGCAVGSGVLELRDKNTGGGVNVGPGTVSPTGVWTAMAARSTSSLRSFFIGGGQYTDTTSIPPGTALNQIEVGNYANNAGGGIMRAGGLIAECAIWASYLSDAACQELTAGLVNPLDVSPGTLIGYWPLRGDLLDLGPMHYALAPMAGSVPAFSASHPLVVPAQKRPRVRLFAASGGSTTLAPGFGAVTFTGQTPTLALGTTLAPGVGLVSFAGLTPSVTAAAGGGVSLAPGVGAVLFTGLAPSLVAGVILAPGAGSVTFAGLAPTVTAAAGGSLTLTPGTGAVAFTGYAPAVASTVSLAPGTGALTFSGLAPSIAIALSPGPGALAFTGLAPAVALGTVLGPGTGAVAFTGYAPSVTAGGSTILTPGAGALAFAGFAPIVEVFNPPLIIPADVPWPTIEAGILAAVAQLSGVPTPPVIYPQGTVITPANTPLQLLPPQPGRSWLLLYNPAAPQAQVALGATAVWGLPTNLILGPGEAYFWAAAQGNGTVYQGAVSLIGLVPGVPFLAWSDAPGWLRDGYGAFILDGYGNPIVA